MVKSEDPSAGVGGMQAGKMARRYRAGLAEPGLRDGLPGESTWRPRVRFRAEPRKARWARSVADKYGVQGRGVELMREHQLELRLCRAKVLLEPEPLSKHSSVARQCRRCKEVADAG